MVKILSVIALVDLNPSAKRTLLVLSVTDKSVVTSGTYVRHLEVDGQSFHHIFDPDTTKLYPVVTELASLTIISDRSVDGRFGPPFVR